MQSPRSPAASARWLFALALLGCAGAHAQGPADWIRVKGATAERVSEPVFKGEIMLYHAGPTGAGKPGAEPVLLVHGLGQSGAQDWAELIPVLADRFDVYALDLPGFGQSDKGNQLYSTDNFAEVIERAVAPRIGRPFILIGHSMGAAVALAYAASFPQRVSHLVLVDMAGILHRSVYAGFLARWQAQQMSGLGGAAVDASWFDATVHRILMKVEQMPITSDLVLGFAPMRQKILKGDPNTIAAFALVDHDFSHDLRDVRAPTLMIWGSEDKVASPRTAQIGLATIPGARLEIIDGAGHVPQKQASTRFNAIVLDELTGKPQGRPRIVNAAAFDTDRKVRCDKEKGARYSGDMRELRLVGCSGVVIDNARIGTLLAVDSDFKLVSSEVRDGIEATATKMEITAGRLAGNPALNLMSATADIAGTRIEVPDTVAVNRGADPVALSISVSELARGGGAPKYIHDVLTLPPGEKW